MGKYILQFGSLAGWPFRLAEGLRAAGQNSLNVIAQTTDVADLNRRLPNDRAINPSPASKPVDILRRASFVMEAARDASLVHYHGGIILGARFHGWLEGLLFQSRGIPMLMSFGGGDGRIVSEARAKNPYFYRPEDPERDAQTRRYLEAISKRIRFAATDCEMITYVAPYFEKCFIFRQPVDLNAIRFVAPRVDRPPMFLHVPTHPEVKGTEAILAAVERLRSEGEQFEFRMKRQLSQAEMHDEIAHCDVYIDELRCGSHGVTAVETMAAGKPTMTYIRPDLVSHYPADLPIVNANPDTIYEKMRELIRDPGMREAISHASRRYAEKYHDVAVVAREMLQVYREIGLKS